MFVYLIHRVIDSDARYLFFLFSYSVKFEPQASGRISKKIITFNLVSYPCYFLFSGSRNQNIIACTSKWCHELKIRECQMLKGVPTG